jgi:hypothetical protein
LGLVIIFEFCIAGILVFLGCGDTVDTLEGFGFVLWWLLCMGKISIVQWKDMKDSGSSDTVLDWMMFRNYRQIKCDDSDQWYVKRCKRKLE